MSESTPHPPTSFSACLSVCLPVSLLTPPSPSVLLSLSVCLSLSVSVSVCLSVCLSLSHTHTLTHTHTHARTHARTRTHVCTYARTHTQTLNRRVPEITGKDNLTVFSYSGRVKSPEWRRQLRRADSADLRQFKIFRHGPVIIYTRLPAGGTYCPICMFPTNSERLIGISDAFSAFVYGYPSSCPRAHCTPNKSVTTLRYTLRHGPVYTGHACRHLLSSIPWISEEAEGIELNNFCSDQ